MINLSPKIIISGQITKYNESEGVEKSLYKYLNNETINYENINFFLKRETINKNTTVFCGGSLFTLSEIIKVKPAIKSYIQDWYYGSNIVNNDIALKKFKKMESVPIWNLNLDLKATDYVMEFHKGTLHFISKNICHDSIIPQSVLQKKSLF